MTDDNPFEVLDLDPSSSPQQLTHELRRRVELAPDDERAQLQQAWRKLTLKDEDRVRLALLTHPRPQAGLDPLTDLRKAVPPFVSREQAEPLEPTVADAMIDDWNASHAPTPPNPWEES